MDPYAKALIGEVDWKQPVFGYTLGHKDQDLARDEWGQRIIGAGLLVLLNAHHAPVHFKLPPPPAGHQWVLEFYTAEDARGPEPLQSASFELTGRSLAVLREVPRDEEP